MKSAITTPENKKISSNAHRFTVEYLRRSVGGEIELPKREVVEERVVRSNGGALTPASSRKCLTAVQNLLSKGENI